MVVTLVEVDCRSSMVIPTEPIFESAQARDRFVPLRDENREPKLYGADYLRDTEYLVEHEEALRRVLGAEYDFQIARRNSVINGSDLNGRSS